MAHHDGLFALAPERSGSFQQIQSQAWSVATGSRVSLGSTVSLGSWAVWGGAGEALLVGQEDTGSGQVRVAREDPRKKGRPHKRSRTSQGRGPEGV